MNIIGYTLKKVTTAPDGGIWYPISALHKIGSDDTLFVGVDNFQFLHDFPGEYWFTPGMLQPVYGIISVGRPL